VVLKPHHLSGSDSTFCSNGSFLLLYFQIKSHPQQKEPHGRRRAGNTLTKF